VALQRLKLNSSEIRKMLRGEGQYAGIAADLNRRAKNIAKAAGDGMEVDSDVGPNRARASVRTATPEAMRREAQQKALTRAIDAGRQ
jgi:predicted GIY-YIG superfamily endonuclease